MVKKIAPQKWKFPKLTRSVSNDDERYRCRGSEQSRRECLILSSYRFNRLVIGRGSYVGRHVDKRQYMLASLCCQTKISSLSTYTISKKKSSNYCLCLICTMTLHWVNARLHRVLTINKTKHCSIVHPVFRQVQLTWRNPVFGDKRVAKKVSKEDSSKSFVPVDNRTTSEKYLVILIISLYTVLMILATTTKLLGQIQAKRMSEKFILRANTSLPKKQNIFFKYLNYPRRIQTLGH